MKIRRSGQRGFTLVEVMIVVLIIGLLATMVSQNVAKSRRTARQKVCIINLKQIDGAIQTWALEFNKGGDQAVSYSDISGYLRGAVRCPEGGSTFEDSYAISTVDTPPTCLRVPSGPFAHALPANQ